MSSTGTNCISTLKITYFHLDFPKKAKHSVKFNLEVKSEGVKSEKLESQ